MLPVKNIHLTWCELIKIPWENNLFKIYLTGAEMLI